MQKIMKGNVEETGKKSITVNISPDMLGDTNASGKTKENSFSTTDLILSMDAAMDYDKKNKKKTEVEQFIRKFETVCASIKETKKDNYGFFWDYYVASSEDPDVTKWLKGHKSETDMFFEWSKSFEWKTN